MTYDVFVENIFEYDGGESNMSNLYEFEENNIIDGFLGKSIGKNEGQLGRPNWSGRKV